MTRIERLLGATAGTEVELAVDLIVTDDWTTPALLEPLNALGTSRSKAPIVLVRDHTQPLATYWGQERERVSRLREIEEEFVRRFGPTRLTGQGIQHHVLPGSGLLRPGMVVLGNDSHTPTLGAHGVAAFAAQPTTIAAAIHTGRLVMRVPDTLRIELTGGLSEGVSVRDAALTLLGLLRGGHDTPRMATGKALEFCGSGLASLSTNERALLANCTPEAVAVTATFSPATADHARNGSAHQLDDWPTADGTHITLDLSTVTATLARSGNPADATSLEELEGTPVHRIFVGTCAGGTFEEISAFASAVGERVVVPSLVAPASLEVQERLRQAGILDRLVAAGVDLLEPGCGPCFGFGVGRLQDGEVAVATGNRNGIGRMGSSGSKVHLGSGRTAGEAARSGWLGGTATGGISQTRSGDVRRVTWPQRGNVVRLHGTISTDDLTPSAVPGVGTSNDSDRNILRRLLLHWIDDSAAFRDLRGTIIVADENFGVGSNRASSIRALAVAGVSAVVARSVAPLYSMGARDEGFPVLTLPDEGFYELLDSDSLVSLDAASGSVSVAGWTFQATAPSDYELALQGAGGVVPYLRSVAWAQPRTLIMTNGNTDPTQP